MSSANKGNFSNYETPNPLFQMTGNGHSPLVVKTGNTRAKHQKRPLRTNPANNRARNRNRKRKFSEQLRLVTKRVQIHLWKQQGVKFPLHPWVYSFFVSHRPKENNNIFQIFRQSVLKASVYLVPQTLCAACLPRFHTHRHTHTHIHCAMASWLILIQNLVKSVNSKDFYLVFVIPQRSVARGAGFSRPCLDV